MDEYPDGFGCGPCLSTNGRGYGDGLRPCGSGGGNGIGSGIPHHSDWVDFKGDGDGIGDEFILFDPRYRAFENDGEDS